MKTIQEWWEEPQKVEEEWADVNKKSSRKQRQQQQNQQGGGYRGRGSGPGRGGRHSRGGGGGRGSGPDRRGRGRGRDSRSSKSNDRKERNSRNGGNPQTLPNAATAATATAEPKPVPAAAPVAVAAPPQPEQAEVHVPVVAPPNPPPQPIVRPAEKVVRNSMPSSGNVWATKGSAHLIQAETKPKPPPVPAAPTPAILPQPSTTPRTEAIVESTVHAVEEMKESLEPKETEPATLAGGPPTALESGLPASVNGANVNAAGWKPVTEATIDSAPSSARVVQDVAKESAAAGKQEPTQNAPKPPPTSVLNMGRWEAGDTDETQNIDFGFGSFGTESEAPSVAETTMSSGGVDAGQPPKETAPPPAAPAAPTTTVSPARPPPGLSISGMPPMHTSAVLVTDLENKLEKTSLGQKPAETPAPAQANPTPTLPTQPAPAPQESATPILPQAGGMSQNYNTAYGMGMYNYSAGNGFVGMHGAPVLTGGIVPPQQKPQGSLPGQPAPTPSGQGGAPQPVPPAGGLYAPTAPSVGTSVSSENNNAEAAAPSAATTSTMPPGMPGGIPYSPAVFYGQQPPYQMGQPHGSVGYGYGYSAPFGGVQGGFGYQQVMGQGGGYPYDDQAQQQGNANYQKSSAGRYGGRNHTNGNQYQSQYNPPAGYGGQPYNMGYNVDHFGQRAGYGPGSMDPYAMQQTSGSYGQSGIHSFQSDDDHHKGKKGGRNDNLQQGFQQQQQPHQQLGGAQQPFGLQGGAETTNTNVGWSNQGGWGGGPTWQGS